MSKGSNEKKTKEYKFKELMAYSSTEWLADNKKKYRQVFDRFGTSYIYAELSFYNKFFDKGTWDVDITLKCIDLKRNKKEVCSLNFEKKISKYDNIVYIREGWWNKKEGVFWKKGTYYWEAWINGEKVATKYFYVEEALSTSKTKENSYMALESVKLYEGQYDDVNVGERKYLMGFSSDDTRYIYSELQFENVNNRNLWHCELFIKFYNEARELKGQVTRLQVIKKGQEKINVTAGWGSNVKGSWRRGQYTVEIVFLDKVVALVPFEVKDEFIEGLPNVHNLDGNGPIILNVETANNKSFEEVLEELESLVGLTEIKKKVKEHAQYLQFLKLRKSKGFEEKEDFNVHSVFMGNPGTGKTTVAQMMGVLYRKMGLLSKGHVHEVDRVDLVGEYIGQTAPKVKEAIKKARGGVLFIDEAYALARSNDDSKDFGREVIEILVKEMSNGIGDIAVIVAGYPKEMNHFIDSNPGLKSRFKQYYEFKDYLPQELIKIAEYASAEKEVFLTDDAKSLLEEMVVDAYRNRNKNFGNARYVYDLIEKSKINLGIRVMKKKKKKGLDNDFLATIELEDVQKLSPFKKGLTPNIPIDDKLLSESLSELDDLIGIEDVKKEIRELVEIVRFHKETARDVLSKFYLHTIFVGNPGTGKTTVARILTKIFKALGILERGHMVETDRQGLVAGFVGQTAMKTAERIDEALGGVLFIDEAYALSNFNGLQGDFGNEAIQTILKRMEDQRGEFFVFAAGYPDNMNVFLKANPGLKSRFDKVFKFDDYTPTQLTDIAIKMFDDEGYRPKVAAIKVLESSIKDIHLQRDKFFGNARTARKLVLDSIKGQNLRYAKIDESNRTKQSMRFIEVVDIQFAIDKNKESEIEVKSIGFNSN